MCNAGTTEKQHLDAGSSDPHDMEVRHASPDRGQTVTLNPQSPSYLTSQIGSKTKKPGEQNPLPELSEPQTLNPGPEP